MTNHWVDIKNADVILIMGGNAAEAHPCGFKWVTEAKAKRGAKLVVVDPRFTRSAAVADYYAPLRVGTDIAFLGGVMNYLLANGKYHRDYMLKYTDATFLVNPEYGFKDGYFSGWDAQKKKYDKATWAYQKGADGFVAVDETLKNPNCVFNLMKRHYARYTPEAVSNITGTPKDQFLKVCELIAGTAAPNKTLTILYALGWTQHTVGSQNIRMMAMIQLMLGNVGMAGGGVNALRGHANVQGITDMNLVTNVLPGYMVLPSDKEQTREKYLEARTPKPLRPGQMNFPANFPKWHTSLMKAWYGNAATEGKRLPLRLDAEDRQALRRAAHVRAHASRQDERLRLPGLQSAGGGAEPAQAERGAVEAQVPGRHRSARYRDRELLAEPRRAQRREDRRHPDRGVPPAGQLLRRAQRYVHQLRARHPVALEGRRRSGRGDDGYRHHREYLHTRARAVPEKRRCLPGAGARPHVGLSPGEPCPRPKSC